MPTHRLHRHAMALGLLALAGFGVPAQAADMLEGAETQIVEYGTGWYLRGDVSFTAMNDHTVANRSSLVGNQILTTTFDAENVFAVGAAVGYLVSPSVRAELAFDYLAETSLSEETLLVPPSGPCISTGGQPISSCTLSSSAEYSVASLMGNFYYDLPVRFGGLRPFVGAGVGVLRNEYSADFGRIVCTDEDPNFGVCSLPAGAVDTAGGSELPGATGNGTAYHLAGSITAGVAYDLTRNMKLETAYRYKHAVDEPMWGGGDSLSDVGAPNGYHTLRMGLRLELW